MWWGGFSEAFCVAQAEIVKVLIPMWWGGFSEDATTMTWAWTFVLIPMWWGGFSESGGVFSLLNSAA